MIKKSDEKLKILRPTLKMKKRFVKVKINSSKKFKFEEVSKFLSKELIFYIGSIDYSKAGIWLLKDKFNFSKQEFILKTQVSFKEKLIAALLLISKLDKTETRFEVIRVSGTLKGLEK